MKVLFAASEAFPLVKTGGLGDVVYSLSRTLIQLGDDVKVVLPAYLDVLSIVYSVSELASIQVQGMDDAVHDVRILEAHVDAFDGMIYLIDVPALYGRAGNPYVQPDGTSWPDNAERFAVFSRAVAELAAGTLGIDWVPDVIHCHDWQTGLVPAFLSTKKQAPHTVFTIHNLAYDGWYTHDTFESLGLEPTWWSPDHMEFYGGLSMIKAGIVFSEHVTTVSPTYAKEICTPEFGYRYEGILQHVGDKLSGILNGIDLNVWNPRTDHHICQTYSVNYRRNAARKVNKQHLLHVAGLPESDAPLLGFIGRLVEQKGADLIAAMLPRLFDETDANVVLLGSGDKQIELQLINLAGRFPFRLHVYIGYSEDLAHQIEAGCDLFLMPSRFEPCGLNQMYSLRYGTPPVVNHTGGLADTVIDVTPKTIQDKTANGFVTRKLDAAALLTAIKRAMSIYKKPRVWNQICRTAMESDFGWESSARQYQNLYQNRR